MMRERTCERHGHATGGKISPEYNAWAQLIARCTNPKHPKYPDYGGRGIAVCDEWRASFSAFLQDMGPRPSPTHSIEREDNEKGYDRANCSWATRARQSRNKRSNRHLMVDGEPLCLADAAHRAGLKLTTLRMRLVNGWELQKALDTPVQPRSSPGTPSPSRLTKRDGVRALLVEAARAAGLHPATVSRRLSLGWPLERALSTPYPTFHRSA